MRRVGLLVALTVFVVGAAGAAWSYERNEDARQANIGRRDMLERTFANNGTEEGLRHAAVVPQSSPDAWLAAAMVLGSISLMGVVSALVVVVEGRPASSRTGTREQ